LLEGGGTQSAGEDEFLLRFMEYPPGNVYITMINHPV